MMKQETTDMFISSHLLVQYPSDCLIFSLFTLPVCDLTKKVMSLCNSDILKLSILKSGMLQIQDVTVKRYLIFSCLIEEACAKMYVVHYHLCIEFYDLNIKTGDNQKCLLKIWTLLKQSHVKLWICEDSHLKPVQKLSGSESLLKLFTKGSKPL